MALLDRVFAAPGSATPPEVARRLNLELCPRLLSEHEARAKFQLDLSALHPSASVHVCQRRTKPHAGIVYITNFLGTHEHEQLHAREPRRVSQQ